MAARASVGPMVNCRQVVEPVIMLEITFVSHSLIRRSHPSPSGPHATYMGTKQNQDVWFVHEEVTC